MEIILCSFICAKSHAPENSLENARAAFRSDIMSEFMKICHFHVLVYKIVFGRVFKAFSIVNHQEAHGSARERCSIIAR